MSRPKVIKLEQGEVSLQGFPKEISEALTDHIKSFGKEGTCVVLPSDTTELKSKAIGVLIEGDKVSLVTVTYDAESKQAMVETVEKCDGKRHSVMMFKMAADRLNFV